MTKIICDRCGTDMTQSGAFGRIEMKIYQRQDFIGDPVHRMIDGSSDFRFCKKCMDTIYGLLFMQDAEMEMKPEDVLPAKKKAHGRNSIDYGKIMALRNAGWDNGKIADEMHMSKASVSQAVSKYKKMKMEGNLDEAENKGAVSDNQDTV